MNGHPRHLILNFQAQGATQEHNRAIIREGATWAPLQPKEALRSSTRTGQKVSLASFFRWAQPSEQLMSQLIRRVSLLFAICVLIAAVAAGFYVLRFWSEHGEADPTRYDRPAASTGLVSYRKQIKPILEGRCVVCHACYDAPCQLKLGSWEGIARPQRRAGL